MEGVGLATHAFLVSVAAVIGTGVLGLPVSLWRSRLAPFTAVFSLTALAQVASVAAMVELLQRAAAAGGTPTPPPTPYDAMTAGGDAGAARRFGSDSADVSGELSVDEAGLGWDGGGTDDAKVAPATRRPAAAMSSVSVDSDWDGAGGGGQRGDGRPAGVRSSAAPPPSLFAIAEANLDSLPARLAFYGAALLQFVAILTSYGLAGPQAYHALFSLVTGTEGTAIAGGVPRWAILAFILPFSAIICGALEWVLPALSAATAVKGALFTGVIVLVSALPAMVGGNPVPPALQAGVGDRMTGPFLMGTVALGGLANVLPVMWDSMGGAPTKTQVRTLRAAVVGAIVGCWALNVVWCRAVLAIVPRTAAAGLPSLSAAHALGQISTVPLIQQLRVVAASEGRASSPAATALHALVDAFVAISVTVSFGVMGAGYRHLIDGLSDGAGVPRVAAYVPAFGAVATLAVTNPAGFISVIERASSLGLNVQAGFFVVYMLWNARRKDREHAALLALAREQAAALAGGRRTAALGSTGATAERPPLPPGAGRPSAPLGDAVGVDVGSAVGKDWTIDLSVPLLPSAVPPREAILLPLRDGTATVVVLGGMAFFAFASIIDVVAPLLGIDIGGAVE
ncbi:hypothetical protein BU14_0074s0002 [Porphyra umbilicalis]|uniref:Amino acid transporter transmembrane domain-containing protein n=1 Tax=Porphyra umbilicalis TaxID=2786 RepID=A0A1X6PFF1_PORUM|nr:hypothetical protein BU14_0074s0002 [Porphyra umbilicalis]|eukprot:OSX79571.1 hypothetical protein BU14_0074s0002 [Porphyra umbilicalis]